MKIKYIAWKKVINSDVNRLIYATQGAGLHNRGDHAIQNFNTLNENPGLWAGFTAGMRIPRKKEVEAENRANGTHQPTTFDIALENSVNPLRLWEDKNDARQNPVKINHEIWDRNYGHEKAIIESWYLGYMRLLERLLSKLIERDDDTAQDAKRLLSFVDSRLKQDVEIRANILKWIYNTQDGFAALQLDTSFMENSNLRDINGFIEQNFYIVVKCEENGQEKNMALMADSTSAELHPTIRNLLLSNEKGGEYVDIHVSVASSSPDAQRFLSALYDYKNIILYGPPGTGKTHLLKELMQSFNAEVLFDDLDTIAPFRVTSNKGSTAMKWCTFHPSYSYESFVTGIVPEVVDNALVFKPHVGPLLEQSMAACGGSKSLLVIDEINRAKADDVFGATMAILDRGLNEKIQFTHPFEFNGATVDGISASDNLYIVGTMNSLDKSTTPLSVELKRRFIIIEIKPNVEVLRCHLQRNQTIPEDLIEFCCDVMSVLNERIHTYCGKEFELGQGYFWSLVEAKSYHQEIMADIISNKIIPHLKDILPLKCLNEFFSPKNIDTLFSMNNYGYDYADISSHSDSELINAFAIAIDSDYRCETTSGEDVDLTFEKYENAKTEEILKKLLRYKNIILTGVSGTGKSHIANAIQNNSFFTKTAKMHWHSSTEYADVIEGISATVDKNKKINYAVLPGMVRQLANNSVSGAKLMVIEGVNKSNAAENFGELITLLEPDKRHLKISGTDGDLSIPSDMYFLCTMNPNVENQYKLDSAMKRRFVIIDLFPDYKLLSLHLNVPKYEKTLDIEQLYSFSTYDIKCLAIQILKSLNTAISLCVDSNYQIGHSVFWNLTEDCNVADLLKVIDLIIIPQIEEFCYDEDITKHIFGNTPAISFYEHGIEVNSFSSLNRNDTIKAIKGLLSNE